jgi:hypothetical protein
MTASLPISSSAEIMTALPLASLDHVVVNTRDRLVEAAEIYRRLGFHLTPLGRHSLGSINRLAIFGHDYLELVGVDPDAATKRLELLSTPAGLDGLVFATEDADGVHAALAASLALEAPLAFSRPVTLASGTAEVRFRVVRLKAPATPYGRVYFCQHLDRALVWRDEWRDHPNGAVGIARLVIAAADPAATAGLYRTMFGGDAVRTIPGGQSLTMGMSRVDFLSPEALAAALAKAAPDPQGRRDYMAALTIKTVSLDRARGVLGATAIAEPGRLLVSAAAAGGATLEFVE